MSEVQGADLVGCCDDGVCWQQDGSQGDLQAVLATEDGLHRRAVWVSAYLGRTTRMKTVWTCMKCHYRFEAAWTGIASVMGRRCKKCRGIAISSSHLAVEDGVLVAMCEKKLRAKAKP